MPTRLIAVFPSAASTVPAAQDFGPWAVGTSPREIGRRITDNILPLPLMPWGKDPVIHYAEVCTCMAP